MKPLLVENRTDINQDAFSPRHCILISETMPETWIGSLVAISNVCCQAIREGLFQEIIITKKNHPRHCGIEFHGVYAIGPRVRKEDD